MASKRFCDLCDKPASEVRRLEVERRFGSTWEDEEYQKRRAAVTVSTHFGFSNHPQGFGGPPDLCKECMVNLLEELLGLAKR